MQRVSSNSRQSCQSGRLRARGFTLIELMVTVAVLAVMLGMAIPSFRYVHNSSRLSGAANELVATLKMASNEAIRGNGRVVVCTSNLGAACDKTTTASGLLVFVDANRDNDLTAGETILRTSEIPVPVQLETSAGVAEGVVQYRSDGLARNKNSALLTGQYRVCMLTSMPSDNIRDISIDAGGRVEVRRASGAGSCATPANL